MDQSQRAAPHDFSQLATSFLACPRLGILRAPLLRLTRFHSKNRIQPTSTTHNNLWHSLIFLLSFPHPNCQKTVGLERLLAFPAKLTKLKDPPKVVNPASGLRFGGSAVGTRADMTSLRFYFADRSADA
jgi:hypothetical protein